MNGKYQYLNNWVGLPERSEGSSRAAARFSPALSGTDSQCRCAAKELISAVPLMEMTGSQDWPIPTNEFHIW